MKMQELNNAELQEVNGGSIFGGNDSSSSSNSGLIGNLGIGNLLSFSSTSKDGDESRSTSFSLGNDITSNLGGIFNQLSSQS
ncbi:hypothetical protein EWM62_00605 [Mucilaginibacter terrigena]|uniref:Bacteriocin n=1 Tax=Mucilaginibacter terrigena TaxID=2492395 RepID=A0A4Q5LR44_9SPHI|nr:hypothetical protein [Mucilaginibacter terrigena]RYU91976.1 hypothetical protein EWM62_00605 [Mucilaginibacter terrigena]